MVRFYAPSAKGIGGFGGYNRWHKRAGWMRKVIITIILLALPIVCFAETIVLKSGEAIEGKIIERTDGYIRIDFEGVPLTYFLDDVESIEGKEPALSQPKETRKLSSEDIQHGKQQVQNMLRDRPAMQKYVASDGVEKYVTEDDIIFQWVVRKFAGEDLSATIDWNPDPPHKPDGIDADHGVPYRDKRGFIRVRKLYSRGPKKGEMRSFEDLWASIVFELLNITNADKFSDVWERALMGKVSKEEWVKENSQIEFEAAMKTKEFYRNIWEPWSIRNNFKISQKSPFAQRMSLPDSYSEWIKPYYLRNSVYITEWERVYKEKIVPKAKELEAIIKLYEQQGIATKEEIVIELDKIRKEKNN